MPLFARDQIWAQKKGWVKVRVNWFCEAGKCPVVHPTTYESAVRFQDHVHVNGWHGTTMQATQHSVLSVRNLLKEWRLEA